MRLLRDVAPSKSYDLDHILFRTFFPIILNILVPPYPVTSLSRLADETSGADDAVSLAQKVDPKEAAAKVSRSRDEYWLGTSH